MAVPSVPAWQRCFSELVGTMVLVLAGTGAVVVAQGAGGPSSLGVAAVFGVALAMLVYSLGHVSGAHFNPAVTVAFALSRDFPARLVPGYVLSQLAGATLASVILAVLFGTTTGLGATAPHGSVLTALLAEVVMGFVLMFVVESVATDTRAIGAMAGLAAGAALLLGVFLAGPLSGGSVNPARSFGPALVTGSWTAHWVYWLGPVAGAIAGGMCYRLVRAPLDMLASRQATRPGEVPPPAARA